MAWSAAPSTTKSGSPLPSRRAVQALGPFPMPPTPTPAQRLSAGTLMVNGSTHASSAVTVASAAALGGDGTVGGSATFNNSSIFAWNLSVTDPSNNASPPSRIPWQSPAIWWTSKRTAAVRCSRSCSLVPRPSPTTSGPPTKAGATCSPRVIRSLSRPCSPASAMRMAAAPSRLHQSALVLPQRQHAVTFTAVPEPTSALAGLLLTAGLLRRRRK